MNNLIRAEFYKLERNPAFWALVFSVTGLSTLLHFLILTEWWYMSGTPFYQAGLVELNGLSPFITPLFFNLLVGTLAAYSIATEFSRNGVIRNQIMSGNQRNHIFLSKFTVFSLGSFFIVIVIPMVTALILATFFGNEHLLTVSQALFIARSYGLFFLHFLCFTGMVLFIAILSEDSGRTILFTLLLSVVMFAIEKLVTTPFIKFLYEQTFFYQMSNAFNHSLSSGEITKSIVVGIVSLLIILGCGMFMFKKKEFH